MPRVDDRGHLTFAAAVPLIMEGSVEPEHSRFRVPKQSLVRVNQHLFDPHRGLMMTASDTLESW